MIHLVWQVSVFGVFCALARKGYVARKPCPGQSFQSLAGVLSDTLALRRLGVG